jgi:hypothetical protein
MMGVGDMVQLGQHDVEGYDRFIILLRSVESGALQLVSNIG